MFRFMVPVIVVMLGFGLVVMVCHILCAMWIRKRAHRTLCQVCAGIACLAFPFGTIIGVFTFIVLGRDSVRMQFAVPQLSIT